MISEPCFKLESLSQKVLSQQQLPSQLIDLSAETLQQGALARLLARARPDSPAVVAV